MTKPVTVMVIVLLICAFSVGYWINEVGQNPASENENPENSGDWMYGIEFLGDGIYHAIGSEYQGNGPYHLQVGDYVVASTGHTIILVSAIGELGSRSDWMTSIWILAPGADADNFTVEDVVDWHVTWGHQWTKFFEDMDCFIKCERSIGGEAIITVLPPIDIMVVMGAR